MHVSVPQCDVFGYFSIESEIVILIIPVDHYPKALQVGLSTRCTAILSLSSLVDLGGGPQTRTREGPGVRFGLMGPGFSSSQSRSVWNLTHVGSSFSIRVMRDPVTGANASRL